MLGSVLLITLVLASAVGCAADPVPAPTSSTFATEAEAFTAAEATYRAYVDALNQVDLSDPATFEGVYAWTTGEANAGARVEFSQMHADGLTVSGPTEIRILEPRSGTSPTQLDVCLDVSGIQLTNPSGLSVVTPGRSDVQAMRVSFVSADTPTGALINYIDGRDDGPTCDA